MMGLANKHLCGIRGNRGQLLDLAIVPETLSVDIRVEKVWDFTQMQHHAIFIWAHVAPGEDNSRQ